MKNYLIFPFTLGFVLLWLSVSDVSAQTEDQATIKKALQSTFDALNTQNAEEFFAFFHPTATYYDAQGYLREQSDPAGLEKAFSAGLRFDLQPENITIAMYANSAVVTNLYGGTMTLPSGKTEKMANRSTSVWVKEGNEWKLAHYHDSPLIVPEK